ncbi:MAG: hypothetical protein NKF70_10290 [Methanobacterium sp. ERen5]|nr:MAG: hypothetical protein NKF70_10290 [Methanobacterium sp. ERen5]
MEDLSGLGKSASINSESTPTVCSRVGVTANSAICDKTDCPSYGKWYCPFTGW